MMSVFCFMIRLSMLTMYARNRRELSKKKSREMRRNCFKKILIFTGSMYVFNKKIILFISRRYK